MLRDVSGAEVRLLCGIVDRLARDADAESVREGIADDLLRLVRADYFASFVWDEPTGTFGRPVFRRMSSDNLARYAAYYQFHDPITPALQRRRRATLVVEVMPQAALERTEFFNDFLARDGLHHGINVYAYDGDLNIGDLRIWRGRGAPEFGRREVALLDFLNPYFRNALRNAWAVARAADDDSEELPAAAAFGFDGSGRLVQGDGGAERLRAVLPPAAYLDLLRQVAAIAQGRPAPGRWHDYAMSRRRVDPVRDRVTTFVHLARMPSTGTAAGEDLTRREADICRLVVRGLTDREIAAALGIAVSTVRTHLKAVFAKLDATTRTELAWRLSGRDS